MCTGIERCSARASLRQKRRSVPTGNFLDMSLGKDLVSPKVPFNDS